MGAGSQQEREGHLDIIRYNRLIKFCSELKEIYMFSILSENKKNTHEIVMTVYPDIYQQFH
jgi:hypothetical protein